MRTDFDKVMQKPVNEVLVFATYLINKVEYIKTRPSGS